MLDQLFDLTFLNKAASFSILDILIALAISFVIGLFIFMVYKKTYTGVMYSSSFGISLIAMDLITTLVILAVSSNLITSLGMVGALSIIRFRTVVKDPLDLVYLFWSITVGIIVGAGLIPLAVIGSVVIGITLFVFVNRKVTDTPYVVVINCDNENAETESMTMLQENTKKYLVKSKNISKNGIELTVEVRLKDSSVEFLNKLLNIGGVLNAVLVSYNGDYYM
ncbi:MAG: DUF4956 domain-containing protein [Natronincolaceae bacterium]|jgi:uncharacterized membrane protein YhiD involved in acid resistance